MKWIALFFDKCLGRFLPARKVDQGVFTPTGQSLEEILAIRNRAERETNEPRMARLGVSPEPPRNTAGLRCRADIAENEYKRPQKDQVCQFSLLGSPCEIHYFSDYRLIEYISDAEARRNDPRCWVDVFYQGVRYGYKWPDGYWTHSAEFFEGKEVVDSLICEKLNLFHSAIEIGSIKTTNRRASKEKYSIFGRAGDVAISAEFRHRGYVIYFEVNGIDSKFNTREGTLELAPRFRPLEPAIRAWLRSEHDLLTPLGGTLPPASQIQGAEPTSTDGGINTYDLGN